MNFIYFKGPRDDMADLIEGSRTCSICGKESDHCFGLDYAVTNLFNDEEKEGKAGCYDCLRKGEFIFWHDTEYGMLDNFGLTKVYNHNSPQPPALPEEVLTELGRTPQIVTYQQEIWLTHCNDFMVYKGTWQPGDFYENSANGDGKALFMEMTDEDMNHIWEESLPEGETLLEDWYPTYYVFECRHCGKLRGNWDCD